MENVATTINFNLRAINPSRYKNKCKEFILLSFYNYNFRSPYLILNFQTKTVYIIAVGTF